MAAAAAARRLLPHHRHLRLRHLSTTTTLSSSSSSSFPLLISRSHLQRLARERRFAELDSLLTPHLSSPSRATSAAAIAAFSAAGMVDRAASALSSLPSPSTSHLNALLSPLSRVPRLASRVPDLLKSLSSSLSLSPDAVSFSILIKSICVTDGAAAALPVLDRMQSKRIPASVVTYTTLLDSFYKENLPEQAEKVWKDMLENGIAPDNAAYNVRVMHKVANGTPESVKDAILEMEAAGLTPDTITWNYLMEALARHGRIAEAVEVYEGLEKKGCVPNSATFRHLLMALCKSGEFGKAVKVFDDAMRRRKVPDFGTVKRLVEGLVKEGKGRAARRAVTVLRKKFPEEFVRRWTELEKLAGVSAEDSDSAEEQPAAT